MDPTQFSELVNLIKASHQVDPNWFLSAVMQSSAAIVAIVAGFLVSEYLHRSDKLTSYFDDYRTAHYTSNKSKIILNNAIERMIFIKIIKKLNSLEKYISYFIKKDRKIVGEIYSSNNFENYEKEIISDFIKEFDQMIEEILSICEKIINPQGLTNYIKGLDSFDRYISRGYIKREEFVNFFECIYFCKGIYDRKWSSEFHIDPNPETRSASGWFEYFNYKFIKSIHYIESEYMYKDFYSDYDSKERRNFELYDKYLEMIDISSYDHSIRYLKWMVALGLGVPGIIMAVLNSVDNTILVMTVVLSFSILIILLFSILSNMKNNILQKIKENREESNRPTF